MRLFANDVTYSYQKSVPAVLSKLSFAIESKSYWCIAGPNGSGKSTFLKLACGLLPSDRLKGEISWDGRALASWDRLELSRAVAFVPGSLKTMFPVTTEEFVVQGRYARTPYWMRSSPKDYEIARSALERVGIPSCASSDVSKLSAGQMQLALIARAITQEPEALVLDEATANLDPGFQARIFELLAELNAHGLTILVVSHDLNLAAEFCPNFIWMKKGALFLQGPVDQTITRELLQELYGVGEKVAVGKNPFTGRPKIFWRHKEILK